jgi:arginyl-tRNA synthetase
MPQNTQIQQTINKIFLEKFKKPPQSKQIELSFSKIPSYHYQSSLCLKEAHAVQLSPLQMAEEICRALCDKGLYSVATAPGFINIVLTDKQLLDDLQTEISFIENPGSGIQPQTIIVDYSSPNVAKELHVGHLRSTVIGDALAHCLEYLGHNVLKLNHVGDWGTAFGMLISYLKRHKCDPFADNCNLATLMHWYQESKKEFDASSEIYEDSKRELVRLQSGDTENIAIWQRICEISEKGYSLIYQQLNVDGLITRGESFYQPYIPSLLDDLTEKNLITISQGAKCLFLDGFYNRQGEALPLIVQKSDGGFNYATTDLAALRYRMTQDKADKIFYVTDQGQKDHFAMIFKAAEKAGYAQSVQLMHVPFGLVQNDEGKRYKTRSGSIVRLQQLLDEAYARALSLAEDRCVADKENFAKVVGFGAIKYADLSTNRLMNYVFDFDKMLGFDGNTVVYLLYVFVRTASLLRKAQAAPVIEKLNVNKPLEESEQRLVFHLTQFSRTLHLMARDACPHYLTDYLYQLCSYFNQFFRDCVVLNHQDTEQRLIYVAVTAQILKKGLDILGIGTINEM